MSGEPLKVARKKHDRRLRAAFERDTWAGEWNSLPTAIDAMLSDVAAHTRAAVEQELAAWAARIAALADEWDAADEHGNPLREGSLSEAADELRNHADQIGGAA